MNKAFSLIETLVVMAMVALFATLIMGAVATYNGSERLSDEQMVYWNPEVVAAKAQRDIAREMAENNRLLREQIQAQKESR